MQIIDSIDFNALWSNGGTESGPVLSALWLPVRPEDESFLVAQLCASWRELEWFALGTWYIKKGSVVPSRGFTERYPEMARKVVARSNVELPRGLDAVSEWCSLNPESALISDFLASARKAKGKGMCLTLLPVGTALGKYHALSAGMVWRATLAIGSDGGADIEETDRTVVVQYLEQCSRLKYACIVPLDHHPWGGCAVVADKAVLAELAQRLPEDMPVLVKVDPAEVVRGGGRLAL